jgi:hypothetical protein
MKFKAQNRLHLYLEDAISVSTVYTLILQISAILTELQNGKFRKK